MHSNRVERRTCQALVDGNLNQSGEDIQLRREVV